MENCFLKSLLRNCLIDITIHPMYIIGMNKKAIEDALADYSMSLADKVTSMELDAAMFGLHDILMSDDKQGVAEQKYEAASELAEEIKERNPDPDADKDRLLALIFGKQTKSKDVPGVAQETNACSQEDADKVAALLGDLIEAVRISTAINEKQTRVKQLSEFRSQLDALSASVSKAIYKIEGDQYAMLDGKPSLKDSIARMHDFLTEKASR